MVNALCIVVALAAVAAILRGGFRAGAKVAIALVALIAVYLLKTFDAKFWGVVIMGGAVLILFFLPWLDHSPVKSIRYRPSWHRIVYGVFLIFFLALGYLGSQPPSPAGNYISQLGTLVYFGFFLLMPWWSRMGVFRPVPDRVTFNAH
jgi:ubiquinol-cytochrome c reductase cytochrome b subunit